MSRSKKTGTFHETHTTVWLKQNGWPYARRIVMKGQRDEGDIDLGNGIPVVIEAKAEKAITLADYIKELDAEIVNANAETGFVIIKKRGTTDVSRYYALTTVGHANALLRQVYKVQKRRLIRSTHSHEAPQATE
jgi:hypothetical protein